MPVSVLTSKRNQYFWVIKIFSFNSLLIWTSWNRLNGSWFRTTQSSSLRWTFCYLSVHRAKTILYFQVFDQNFFWILNIWKEPIAAWVTHEKGTRGPNKKFVCVWGGGGGGLDILLKNKIYSKERRLNQKKKRAKYFFPS